MKKIDSEKEGIMNNIATINSSKIDVGELIDNLTAIDASRLSCEKLINFGGITSEQINLHIESYNYNFIRRD